MPLFDYKCASCGYVESDVLIYSSVIRGDHPVLSCPQCNSSMTRQIGSAHARFSGGGFYETDYKEKPKGE